MSNSTDHDNKSDKLSTAQTKISIFGDTKSCEEFAESIAKLLIDAESKIAVDPKDPNAIFQVLAHSHDLLCRSVLKNEDIAANFFENHIDPKITKIIDFSKIKCCNSDDIDKELKERIGDICYLTKSKPTQDNSERLLNVMLFFEHQSTPDPIMSVRILEQIARASRQFINNVKNSDENTSLMTIMLPFPFAVIFYNGKTKWECRKLSDMIDIPEGFDKNVLDFTTVMIDVSSLTDEQLNRGLPIVRALMQTFHYEAKNILSQNYEKIFRIIAEASDDPRVKDWFSQFLLYVVSHCSISHGKEVETIEKIYTSITQNPEEAKNMADSIAHALIKQGIEKGIDIGIEKGIDIGIEKGREEGSMGIKKNILMYLSKRFNCFVPRDIQGSVNSYSDLIALESLFQRALDSESIDEFREYLVR
jgi:hypothetical protein